MSLDPENMIVMELKTGSVTIALRPDLAPNHVDRIKALAREGFYDGVVFHRVIPGFMAQTGDPTGTGMGGSKLPDLMARSSSPDSANSQFFVCFDDAPWLDRQYTIWGEVTEGMEHIDAVKKGSMHNNGAIDGEPDKILKVRIAADATS